MTRIHRLWPWWRWVLTGLSALALALSAYLGWHSLVGGSVIGCGGGSPCGQVLNSRWSTVGGVVPVSSLAAGAYLALLVASLFIGPATAEPDQRLAWGAMLVLLGAAAGSAVWFTIVQKWVVGAFCPYCMATHITGVLLAALVLWRAPRQFDARSTDGARMNPAPAVEAAATASPYSTTGAAIASPVEKISPDRPHHVQRVMGPWPALGLTLIGLALAGILAALQFGFTPPAVYRGGASQDRLPVLDPHAVPLVGSPDAPTIITLLFDYQCPHCQHLHSMLEEAVGRYDGKVAFALCPAPLNSQCNPYVAQDVDEFKDSCELTRVALAVWVAQRAAFPAFDRWMFSPEPGRAWRPRSVEAARAKAVELVGQAKFDAAQADLWIAQYMQTSIRIFGDTIGQGGNAVPKLVLGARWVTTDPNDVDDLVLILHDSLAVPRP